MNNTFHNFTTCIYTAQGKVICNKKKTNVPMLLEGFVNTIPNQKDSECNVLGRKLTNLVAGYNCDISSTNSGEKCSFTFNCLNVKN